MPRTARCYCGASRLSFSAEPLTVSYCHCDDCRRWTGAAAPVLAGFRLDDVQGLGALGPGRSIAPGVRRWNCESCGSPLAGTFDYVPDQAWVPLGVIEAAGDLAPSFHCFGTRAHPWLPDDDLPRAAGSGRDHLNAATPS